MSKTHYETLGVDAKADATTIKNAYRKKAKETHPDKTNGNHVEFQAINRAYQTLSDPDSRDRYDKYGESADKAQTLRQQAEAQVALMIVQGISKVDHKTNDVLAIARQSIRIGIEDFKKEIGNKKKEQQKWIDAKSRLMKKKQGECILSHAFDSSIVQIENQINTARFNIEKGNEMLLVLDEYEWRTDPIESCYPMPYNSRMFVVDVDEMEKKFGVK